MYAYTLSRIPNGGANQWSGPDSRISLLHLAVVRGSPDMFRAVMGLVRNAYTNGQQQQSFGDFSAIDDSQSQSELRGNLDC